MSSLRERLRTIEKPESTLTIRGEKFLVVGLTRTHRAEVFAACRKADGKADTAKMEGVLLSSCVRDPESREELFSPDDWRSWDDLPAAITGPLVAEILSLNGMDNDDIGREVKNSGTTDKPA